MNRKIQGVNRVIGRIIVVIVLAGMASRLGAQHVEPIDWVEKIAASERSSYGDMQAVHKLHAVAETREKLDVTRVRTRWQIDPSEAAIRGEVSTSFRPLEREIRMITFDLSDTLNVNSVMYHGQSLSFEHSDHQIRISLPDTALSYDSIQIAYEGFPPTTGLGSFVQSTHDDAPIVWTLSQPYGARDWWPCRQTLGDKIDSLDVELRVPEGQFGVSNGLRVALIREGNEVRYFWRHRYPIPAYLVCLAVTNYNLQADSIKRPGLPSVYMENYLYPETIETHLQDLQRTRPVMQLFDSLLIPYPYANEKYGHAQFGRGGGMEHTTISFMTHFHVELLSHELIHHWFGNYITCGSWSDIWLNEGFATYFSGITYEHLFPEFWLPWKRGNINRVLREPGGSVFVTDTAEVSRVFSSRLSYSKGALVLHTLRWELGDDTFFAGLRSYLNDREYEHGFVRTRDLQYHMEQVSQKDLTAFFEAWVYGEGYPQYEVAWDQTGEQFEVYIGQQPSHPSVDFFALHVPLQLKSAFRDTIVILDHTYNQQKFEFSVPWPVDSVEVDPDLNVLSGNNQVYRLRDLTRVDVYPVPATDVLQVRLGDPNGGLLAVELLDMQGRIVKERSGLASLQYFQWNMAGVQAGSYILRLQTTRGLQKRLVVID